VASTHSSGPVVETGVVNSQQAARSSVRGLVAFIPACQAFLTTTQTNWLANRRGNGQFSMRHANVDETSVVGFAITGALFNVVDAAVAERGERARGARVNALQFSMINPATGGAALDAAPTLACFLQSYAADAVAFVVGAAVAVTANVAAVVTTSDTLQRRPRWTLDTPQIISALNQVLFAELTINHAATSDLELEGCIIEYDLLT